MFIGKREEVFAGTFSRGVHSHLARLSCSTLCFCWCYWRNCAEAIRSCWILWHSSSLSLTPQDPQLCCATHTSPAGPPEGPRTWNSPGGHALARSPAVEHKVPGKNCMGDVFSGGRRSGALILIARLFLWAMTVYHKMHAHSSQQDLEPRSCGFLLPAAPAALPGRLLGGTNHDSVGTEERSDFLLSSIPVLPASLCCMGHCIAVILFIKYLLYPLLAPYA